MIQDSRIGKLNDKPVVTGGGYVLYWMQQAQRIHGNHALEFATRQANERKLPLVVYFGLTVDFPEANLRHIAFMIEGLEEVALFCRERGIIFSLEFVSPDTGALRLAKDAALLVTDRGYLGIQRSWRSRVAREAPCSMVEVESDVIIPLEVAYPKEAYGAAMIRKKIQALLFGYALPLHETEIRTKGTAPDLESALPGKPTHLLKDLSLDSSVMPSPVFHGGLSEARKRLADFIETGLEYYHERKSDPSFDATSRLSPYLHFGQISPLEIALETMKRPSPGSESFLEELIVRRELSMNFCHYNSRYDSFASLPDWARLSLNDHRGDPRPFLYSTDEMEKGLTHDPYWNAAQREMVATGFMHGYMRMYWGKKIIEWSPSPEEAFRRALYLNNRYQLDGRDANSFAGIAWCFGKHDRPWTRRNVFGSVRYMNDKGLERKFDIKGYVKKIEKISPSLQ